MKKTFWLLMISTFSLLLLTCSKESTEPENGDGLNKRNYMELDFSGNSNQISYNSNDIWISGTEFGPAISSDRDNSWPDTSAIVNFGIYLSGFLFDTGIEPNTVIDLANNTSGIGVQMIMSLTEPSTGMVGETPELSIYPYELSGQLLIHKFEPPSDGADDEYDYLYSVELKNVILGRQTGTIFTGQIFISYASLCRSNTECVDTR